jgi:hypothetical protein
MCRSQHNLIQCNRFCGDLYCETLFEAIQLARFASDFEPFFVTDSQGASDVDDFGVRDGQDLWVGERQQLFAAWSIFVRHSGTTPPLQNKLDLHLHIAPCKPNPDQDQRRTVQVCATAWFLIDRDIYHRVFEQDPGHLGELFRLFE